MMKIIQWNVADKEGGINEVIKGEKKTFLFQGWKILYGRYKNFLDVFFWKRQIAISYAIKSLKIGILCFRVGIKMALLKARLFNA